MSTQVVNSAGTTSFSTLSQSLTAVCFGFLVLFSVGFSPMDVAHNAAHDTRHSLAFPCH
ncbi:CbtB domain-containing protein [Sinobacterium norvegicum]|uniref:CbtB domain-containing protein n=1 Tax=Sinobacterium norvegicum TaxID=1641715 RepID=UPI001F41CB56|nr:CbtB domain-containing protein [Sinobacterium norvegicum]